MHYFISKDLEVMCGPVISTKTVIIDEFSSFQGAEISVDLSYSIKQLNTLHTVLILIN